MGCLGHLGRVQRWLRPPVPKVGAARSSALAHRCGQQGCLQMFQVCVGAGVGNSLCTPKVVEGDKRRRVRRCPGGEEGCARWRGVASAGGRVCALGLSSVCVSAGSQSELCAGCRADRAAPS